MNPVRARLVARAEDWPWNNAWAHLAGADDDLVTVAPLGEAIGDWSAFLAASPREEGLEALGRYERTGRALGDSGFVAALERTLGRRLRPGRPGQRPEERGEGYCVGCPRISR